MLSNKKEVVMVLFRLQVYDDAQRGPTPYRVHWRGHHQNMVFMNGLRNL